MTKINLAKIELSVKQLADKAQYDKEFIFDLLSAYGRAPGGITRLRNGQLNVADDSETDVAQKGIVYFKPTNENLYGVIDELKTSQTVVRFGIRFVIVTDYQHMLAIDTLTNETLDVDIKDIDKHYTFFLPWAGMEKAQYVAENHADVKAAYKMAKLFDAIIDCNEFTSPEEWHGLNVFFTRLLFCYFAEDTELFKKGQFTNAIASYTQHDGSDLQAILRELFTALDIEDKTGYAEWIKEFPYVNGSLLRETRFIPAFDAKSRNLLIKCGGELDWSDINPDIFGSMIQSVVNPGQRAGLGMHYTSVPNIMKTIEPLFLDDLREEYNKNVDSYNGLEKLLGRISKIKIFDPACGSGNFLIIAYKELRKMEHLILERQSELRHINTILLGSRIDIRNFYGIEIDDFAHEVAILSLWLAKHQMNIEFKEKFGIDLPLIPLKESGNIICENATRVNWKKVCPNTGFEEIYLIGNPPYLGSKLQDASQKKDYEYVFGDEPYSKNLDYIALWFIKGARYIAKTNAQLAFVTTNSVSQGEHVVLMFPKIFDLGLEIGFAYTSFKWENNAKHNAGVTVAVINLRNPSTKQKIIFTDDVEIKARNINGYLSDGENIAIDRRVAPLSRDLPEMLFGSMPRDGGFLVLTPEEKRTLIKQDPSVSKFIKKYLGSAEYIRGIDRYCLWIDEKDSDEAATIAPIKRRLEAVSKMRSESDAKSTKDYANRPYRFVQVAYKPTDSIIIPGVSSERREYIPIGYLDKDTVISNAANAIYDAAPYVFGLISSLMHMAWVRAVAGQLGTSIRYSSAVVYNNFPVPTLTQVEKDRIEEKAFGVLDAREQYPDKTLADLYDPDKMPEDLRKAHAELDEVVDRIYRQKPFESDEERLAILFDLYEQMTAKEKK